ncbi:MAG: hypothetical protein COA78_30065 [Blastopirellula sp.]|nr:MAG: hypothetical protein COA78_30065 [Blastopirellula sp.]
MTRQIILLLVVAVLGLSISSQLFARDSKVHVPPIGTSVADFSLKDFRGKSHALADYQDKKIVVLAFLGTECPLARLYSIRLQEIHEQYADKGVAVLGVFANQHDSLTEIGAHARVHKLTFPLMKDVANRTADTVGAQRTPEMVVLDQQRKIQYRGRVDDQYQVGVVRDQVTRNDLITAIDELLAGKPVSLAKTDPIGCHIGRILSPDTTSSVTFAKDIAPILHNRCVECHRDGELAPFALTDYDEVVGWAEMIAEVVEDQRMPPWHANPKHGRFSNDRHLSDEEKNLIFDWVDAGAPKGDTAIPKNPNQYFSGWTIGQEPDWTINITEEPVTVQAEGEVRYRYFRVDPKFKEDVWFKAAQLKPGNQKVVHHILVFALPPGEKSPRTGGGAGGFLVGYVPGQVALPFPKGMAKKIPAGSQLLFQIHYTPIGMEQEDLSQFGLVFANEEEITHEIRTTSAAQGRLNIPPHDRNHKVEAISRAVEDDDVLLLGFMPHMHLRGKSFKYEHVLASGEENTLLDIPAYDFNWQTSYRLAKPISMPKGSKIHATAHFDNSKWNLNNPDPSKLVRWGDQTWEEMMIGYFDIAIPRDKTTAKTKTATKDNEGAQYASKIIKKYDTDGDGIVKRTEVSEKGQKIFDQLDRNKDKIITKSELTTIFSQFPALMKLVR